jgi:hypothetical protein
MAKRKATVGTPTDRQKQYLWHLLRAAGGRAGLNAWAVKYPPPKRGRPPSDFFKDISTSDGPKGLKVVRFRVGSVSYVAIVDPEPRTPKPGLLKYERPHPTIREIVKTMWNAESDPSHIGANQKAVTLWLIRELRKAAKGQK